jgi:hypothetical protein
MPEIWGSPTPGALTCSAKSGRCQVSPVRFAVWRLLMRLDHNSMVQEPCASDHGVRQQYETSAFQYFLKMAVVADAAERRCCAPAFLPPPPKSLF